jgi:hypothetical protein
VSKRNDVPAVSRRERRVVASRVSLSAPLAGALALAASVALLLSLAGAALGVPLRPTPLEGTGQTLSASLSAATLELDGVKPDGVKPNLSSAPTVESIEPILGSTLGGTAVTITGTGFVEGATVKIGSKATGVTVESETEIKATTAATAAGADEVSVTDANGTSTGGPSFTYIAPPKVSSVSPAEGPTKGGTTVKIKGTGFRESSTVTIGGKATAVSVLSETEISAKTPAESAGKDEVVVTDSYGSSTAGPGFTYVAPPKVTSVAPSEGSTVGGTSVVIKGTGFLKGSTVTVGAAATSVVVVSETEVTAKTAAGSAGKDEVVVTDVGGASTAGPKFTYVTPPKVSSVEPATGSTLGGTAVVIKGTGFLAGSTVTIGSKATVTEIVSETEITAKTAATAAGKDEVVVGYASGVVSTGGPSFSYVAPPKVTSVTPAEGSTAGGTVVKIKGTGFLKGSTVAIGAEATGVTVVSETEITAKTAAGSAGKDEVVVTDSSGPSTANPEFTYVTPPKVTSIEPTSGTTLGGTAVVIKGTGFLAGSTVSIGGKVASMEIVSEKEIKAKTAATAAGKDEVIVSYASGVASTAGPSFTYVAPPTVASVTPAEGSTAGGTAIKIKGTGFVAGATVKIGEEEATGVTIVSETEVTAKTGPGAAGKDEVIVTDEKGTSSSGASFSYVAPPKVTSVAPSEGSTVGGTSVVIKGTGFLKGSTVTVGAAATSVVVVSETEVTAKTAAGSAGKDEVVVTDVGGASTAGPKFTYVTPPKVSSVEPATGSTLGGTAVVIKGTGFLAGSTVTIGSKATVTEIVSETEITAKTAATAAGKDEVVVGYASGVVSTGGPSFSYVAPPKVTSVTPAEGSTAGGTVVKIKGTGFLKGSTVAIGAEATGVTVVSETEITAKTAAGSAGKDEVVVTDSSGPSTANPEFTYVTPPKVTSIEPTSGTTLGGTAVVIKGTGFLAGSTVSIGGKVASMEIVSEKEIKAKTAATAAGKDEVIVSYASGVASTAGPSFTYVAPPTVASVTPAEGSTAGGTAIKIKGTGFVAGATVKIGEEEATGVTIVSETEVTAKTGPGAAGKDEVIVTDEKGTSSSGASFTYIQQPKVTSITPNEGSPAGGTAVVIKGTGAAGKDEVIVTDEKGTSSSGASFTYIQQPKVTSITPNEGSPAGGTAVVIKGTGFGKGSTVAIGGAATSVVVVSETEITAKTAASTPGVVEVVVTNTGGSSNGGPKFTYL